MQMQKIALRLVFIIMVILSINEVNAQRLYVHIDGGAVNYGGDLQDKLITLNQANSFFGVGAHYKISNIFSVEAAVSTGKLAASDAKSKTETLRRNLSFYSNLTEGSLVLHANLRDVPYNAKFTPYAMAGVAIFHYNPYAYTIKGEKVYLQQLGTEGQDLPQYPDRHSYNLTQISLPFGGGIKYALSENFIIAAEISFRKLFTDYLDDVSSLRYADTAILRAARGDLAAKMSFRSDELSDPLNFNAPIQRGNPDKKDAYYSLLFKLYIGFDYLLGSGNNGYSKGVRKQSSCPPKVQ